MNYQAFTTFTVFILGQMLNFVGTSTEFQIFPGTNKTTLMGRHMDFRERFLERKRLRSLKDHRIKVLNNYVFNNTEVLDDVAHHRKVKGRSSPTWKKIRALEKDFRRLLAMKGMKYNYKRDLFWRTWRSIPPVNGDTKQIVSYKCNNPIHGNAKECQSCGMWTIEDRTPPCPFEFFSVLSDEKLCGANYTQYKDVSNICASVIKFSDLTATCDNPIETQWRFTKMYGVTEKYNEVICKNKDYCEIFTLYEITPEHVIFRIINSTNDVIYSRIMKAKNRNYICIDDCGRFNPNTRKVAKADKPLKLDLLTVRKSKREDVLNEMNDMQMHLQTKLTKGEDASNEMNDNVPKREDVFIEMNDNLHLPMKLTKGDLSDEMHDGFRKREDVLNEMNDGFHLSTKLTKGDLSNEMHDGIRKREDVLNKINKGLLTTKTEDLNDILPTMEENMSLSNFSGDEYVHISIEDNRPQINWDNRKRMKSIEKKSLHKIKSRGLKGRQQSNINSVVEKRFLHFLLKPTITPRQKMKTEADHILYEDVNLETDN